MIFSMPWIRLIGLKSCQSHDYDFNLINSANIVLIPSGEWNVLIPVIPGTFRVLGAKAPRLNHMKIQSETVYSILVVDHPTNQGN